MKSAFDTICQQLGIADNALQFESVEMAIRRHAKGDYIDFERIKEFVIAERARTVEGLAPAE